MEFTKERLRACAREKVKSLEFSITQTAFADSRAELEEELELARIALASLEAEPVAYIRDGFRVDGVHFCGGIIAAEEHERTKQALSDRYTWKHLPFYTAPPAPVIPEKRSPRDMELLLDETGAEVSDQDLDLVLTLMSTTWNLCRHAMLQGAENAESTTTMQTAPALDSSPKIAESTSGNSPVIPDGWVMLPAEPTQAMMNAWLSEVANWRGHAEGYRAMIAAAPQQEVK